eukprot:3744576-Pyramimonas_sp.AAC.1
MFQEGPRGFQDYPSGTGKRPLFGKMLVGRRPPQKVVGFRRVSPVGRRQARARCARPDCEVILRSRRP